MVLTVEKPFGALMNPLTEHLTEVGETYPRHFMKAVGFGIAMVAAGLACLVHALFPFLFVTTGSTCIRRLHRRMEDRRASIVDSRDPSARLHLPQGGEQLGS